MNHCLKRYFRISHCFPALPGPDIHPGFIKGGFVTGNACLVHPVFYMNVFCNRVPLVFTGWVQHGAAAIFRWLAIGIDYAGNLVCSRIDRYQQSEF